MGEQMEKKFSWVLKKFSSLQDDKCYSRPFAVAGCNWRLLAYPKGDKNNGYLSVYLDLADPAALPPGWRRDVKFSLTLVNKGWGKSNLVLGGKCCFDAKSKSWGYSEFVSLTKLHSRGEGFLVNNKLIILAELHVLPAVVLPEESVKIAEKEGNKAFDASVTKSHGDSSWEVVQKTENAADESLDEDDDASEEGSDDDEERSDDETSDDGSASEEGSDDETSDDDDDDDETSPVSDVDLKDASHTVGNDRIRCNNVEAETEVSNGENDDAPKEDVDDEALSFVLIDSARDGSPLDQVKSVTETSNKLLKEIQPVKETLDVNGFEVYSSQVELVSHIFKRHPDIALGFRPKNQQIRRAYMNELLSLIETLCQSPENLSEDDLSNADDTLVDLIDVGFKLGWLKTKLNEVSEKKKMEQGSGVRLQTMEEQLQKLKLMFLDLETQLQKEKAEALAARVPLTFNDVVC